MTNTLCVHYLAYHRAEVPAADLEAVRALPASDLAPTSKELAGPQHRGPRHHGLTWTLDGLEEERTGDIARWRYSMTLRNRGLCGADLTEGSVTLSLGAVYGPTQTIQIRRQAPPRVARRVSGSDARR